MFLLLEEPHTHKAAANGHKGNTRMHKHKSFALGQIRHTVIPHSEAASTAAEPAAHPGHWQQPGGGGEGVYRPRNMRENGEKADFGGTLQAAGTKTLFGKARKPSRFGS